jgi:hypothetical protein
MLYFLSALLECRINSWNTLSVSLMWFLRSVVSVTRHRLFASMLVFCLLTCAGHVLGSSSVLLTWNPPASGTVAGYHIFYGTQSDVYTNSITSTDPINDPNGFIIANLTGNTTYYFAVQAVDTNGVGSPLSNEASATLLVPQPVVLQTQIYTDDNGVPFAMTISGTSSTTANWQMYSSPDLVNWTAIPDAANHFNGDPNTDVSYDVYFSDAPRLFYRVVEN